MSDTEAKIEPGRDVVIIGAGPAGLTAAYMLTKRGVASTVLEADDVVGGISRTVVRDGWRFDIGGHRFFTKVKPVDDLWFEILGEDDFLRRPAHEPHLLPQASSTTTRSAMNALANLGPVEAIAVHGVVPVGADQAPEGQDHARGLRGLAASAGVSTSTSSRRRARRCGAFPAPRSRPTGARSASRTCRSCGR